MASGGDEVQTGMYTSIMEGHQFSLDLEFLCQVGLKLGVDVVYDGAAAVLLVDLVAIASSAHDSQAKFHIALLQLCMILEDNKKWRRKHTWIFSQESIRNRKLPINNTF